MGPYRDPMGPYLGLLGLPCLGLAWPGLALPWLGLAKPRQGKPSKPSQASMWLPKKAASGGFSPAKTTTPQKKVWMLMVFDTFRLILVQKPSKTTKSLPGEALNKNMASRVDEMQNFESRADETNAERHLGPANMPEVRECCSITSLREHR